MQISTQSANTSPVIEYAGFWRRFAAWIIDLFAWFIASFIIGIIVPMLGYIFFIFFGWILVWIYFAAFESSGRQATLGKMALGIIVTDLNGNRISFGRASGRYFAKIISSAILLIGYLMAGFTEKRQALHDMMAGCLVIKKQ